MNVNKARTVVKSLHGLASELDPILEDIDAAQGVIAERQAAERDLKGLQAEYARVQKKIDEERKAIAEDVVAWAKQRKVEADEHHAKLVAYQDKVEADLGATHEAMARRLKQLKSEMDAMTTEHATLVSTGDHLRASVQALKDELAKLKASIPG